MQLLGKIETSNSHQSSDVKTVQGYQHHELQTDPLVNIYSKRKEKVNEDLCNNENTWWKYIVFQANC